MRGGQRGGVVQPVADHQHLVPAAASPATARGLFLRQRAGLPVVDAQPAARSDTAPGTSPEIRCTCLPCAFSAATALGAGAQAVGEGEGAGRASPMRR
jgi:hypothetical protein